MNNFDSIRQQIKHVIEQAGALSERAAQMQASAQDLLTSVNQLYENTQTPIMDILKVPYRSQWDNDASLFASDCGPACVAIVLDFYGRHVDINQLSLEAGMSTVKRYTLPGDLIHITEMRGVSLKRRLSCKVGDLQAEVKAGRPVIVLIHYGDLGTLRQDTAFAGGHWVVIIGIDDQSVILHDPDWRGERRREGANLVVPRVVFERAWADCILDGNTPNQCLVVVPR